MNILLINPVFAPYGGLKGLGGASPPLNLGYIASYLRDKKPYYKISILDAEALALTFEEIVSRVQGIAPDIIGITINTPVFFHVVKIAEMIKKTMPTVKIIGGGPHPSAMAQETLAEGPIDFVVIGEGEETFLELVDAIENKRPVNDIRGIAYKDGNKVFKNAPRLLIDDLDSLPWPARDLLPHHLYRPLFTKRVSLYPATSIVSGRGCPHDCNFCCAKVVWGRRYRARRVIGVVDEMEYCYKELSIREFSFTDELFTASRQRVMDLCDEVLKRRLKIYWVCLSRVDTLDRQMLRRMKAAGCREVSFGVESGSQQILDSICKGTTIEQVRRTIRMARQAGIKTHASYIIGHIGETESTVAQTRRLAQELNTDIAAFFIASPYPGTALYKEALEKGYIKKNVEWVDFSPLSKNRTAMELPALSSNRMVQLRNELLKGYYLRPRYILRQILRSHSILDIMNIIDGIILLYRIVIQRRKSPRAFRYMPLKSGSCCN